MKRHRHITAVLLLITFVLAAIPFAQAQQPPANPRIGLLNTNAAAAFTARAEGFRQGLRELGYVEGKNIKIEYRYADGKLERLPVLAAELVRLKVVSSSRLFHPQPVRPKKQPIQFPLSWPRITILWEMALLPV
jgi:hypothetical protein